MKTFKDRVFGIRKVLQERIDNSSRDLLYIQIKYKLDRSDENYIHDMEEKTNYILSRNNYKVIKTLNRQLREEEENKKNKGKKDDEEDYVFDLGEGYEDE